MKNINYYIKNKICIITIEREKALNAMNYETLYELNDTLINAIKLVDLAPKEPVERHGQVRWYKKPRAGHAYLAALDPSLGTGGDYAAIQVFELPGMIQCAEWQHNKTTVQAQVNIIKQITKYIYQFKMS